MAELVKSDLVFILQQTQIAEANAAGEDLTSLLPNTAVPWGLRTVDGSDNNLFLEQTDFGAADVIFPRLTDPVFSPAEAGTSYAQTSGLVIDSQPRTISNLLVNKGGSGTIFMPLKADDPLIAGADGIFGTVAPGFSDNELLDAHYIAGDSRINENIGLTTVQSIFHSEHNRQVDAVKKTLLADATTNGDVTFLNQWLLTPVTAMPADPSTLLWNGERLFQVGRFATEMQYQHLVFEEFGRTVQPHIDDFLAPVGFDTTINPAIVAEFAHTVYRFGHLMLLETVDRFDPNFNTVNGDPQIGLIAAFLNPLAFAASGPTSVQAAGAIVRGVTRQAGNNTLTGGAGGDRLTGGTGTDTLTGGVGNDTFVFTTPAEAGNGATRDVITDFEGANAVGGDVIDVNAIDANTVAAGDQTFTFIGTATFTAPGQLRYFQDTLNHLTIIEGNVTGNTGAEFQIALTAPLPLTFGAGDFRL